MSQSHARTRMRQRQGMEVVLTEVVDEAAARWLVIPANHLRIDLGDSSQERNEKCALMLRYSMCATLCKLAAGLPFGTTYQGQAV